MTDVASDRPKVLVIAEAANPEWVSVPLVGWSHAAALRNVADIHLVTQVRNREAISRAGWTEREFTAIDSEALARPMNDLAGLMGKRGGKGWTFGGLTNAVSYPYFERLVWKRFGKDIRAGRFDVVHRITPLTPSLPSSIASKCKAAGVPFVLGPLNGGLPWPEEFDAVRRDEREWLSYVREAYKLLPGRRRTLQAAAAIVVASRYVQGTIPAAYRDKVVYVPENAIDADRFSPPAARPEAAGPLRAAFVGRLVPYKGPDMLLEAAAPLLRDGRMTLEIVGDGPMRSRLEEMARESGIDRSVTFHGNREHEEVKEILSTCRIFPFPSVREFGGGVVLEAMAMGVVPIVVDYGGPGELVAEDTGFLVPLGSRADIVRDLRVRLIDLNKDPSVLDGMADRARKRVETHFTWTAKALQTKAVYDWVLNRGPRPLDAGTDTD